MNEHPPDLARLAEVLTQMALPAGISIRAWAAADMPTIQYLSDLHGWPTQHTPEQVLASWRNAWPAIVATTDAGVVGYLRGFTDGAITTYVADLLVASEQRGRGIGRALLAVCQRMYPTAYLLLVAEKAAIPFYRAVGFEESGDVYYQWER
jgi:ribosomal protein S18 acetylase RimI-like enzyme